MLPDVLHDLHVISDDIRHSLLSSAVPVPLSNSLRSAHLLASLLGRSQPSLDQIQLTDFVQKAFNAHNNLLGEADARKWAGDFVLPAECIENDTAALIAANFDMHTLCTTLREPTRPARYNLARLESVLAEHPSFVLDPLEKERLIQLTEGMIIDTPPGFASLPTPPPLRRGYVDVAPAVNKLHYAQRVKNQVLLVRTETAQLIPGIHFSAQHWALKNGAPQGRAVSDLSNPDTPTHQTVNGRSRAQQVWTKQRAMEKWGTIHLPTIVDIAEMILRNLDLCGGDSSLLVAWKLDLSGAYNLLDFHPSSLPLLAFALSNNTTVIHTTGVFGWVGTPFAFQVISRLLGALSNHILKQLGSEMVWYVDDGIGISWGGDAMATQHLNLILALVRALLGQDAANDQKTAQGRVLDMIGWRVDLQAMTISASFHNLQKAIFYFYRHPVTRLLTLTLTEVQCLASMASRYSMLCRQMRPYVANFNRFIPTFGNVYGCGRHAPKGVALDILLWQGFLALLRFDERAYARSLFSFRRHLPTFLIQYDASLDGMGVFILQRLSPGGNYELMFHTSVTNPFPMIGRLSRFQNLCEFTAVILALFTLRQQGVAPGFSYDLVGDSRASLSWVYRDIVNSEIAAHAHCAFTLLAVFLDATVASTRYISSAENHICDRLSRGIAVDELPPSRRFVVDQVHPAFRFLQLCSPHIVADSLDEHVSLIQAMIAILHSC